MNVHVEYYKKYKSHLEERFPLRARNKRWIYVWQCFIVFGAFILVLMGLFKILEFRKTYKEVAGWDVTLAACLLNLIFAYGFGFVAVVNDWWFFFPDLDTGITWQIGKGQMVLGDIIFYVFATIMGHLAVILTARLAADTIGTRRDSILKLLWFAILLGVIVFGIPFGSQVMRGMVLWLYLPFGLLGLIFIHRYTAFQLWFPTGVFVVCEFLWDVIARIFGIWIFPDSFTHPGLYFNEITLFHLGKYPIIWQPEMTQMAFLSGMICLVFYLAARTFLRNDPIAAK